MATAVHSKSDQARAAIRSFFRIMELWKVTPEQQMVVLGIDAKSTYYHWKKHEGGSLSRDTLERISYVIGIFKALQILLPEQTLADSWVHRPNTAATFRGQSPLERMLKGQVSDLFVVRQYLDAERGGWG